MRVYTVHLRRHGLMPERDLVLVREGFSWWAFLFTSLWALWHRMWWEALGLFAIVLGAGFVAEYFLGEGGGGLCGDAWRFRCRGIPGQ